MKTIVCKGLWRNEPCIDDAVETSGAAIFYTLNGEKPAPFQTIGPAAKATLMYREPFTLLGGKHTIKAVAVSEYVETYCFH